MAEVEYEQAKSSEDLSEEARFGRSFLAEMLAESVHHFDARVEQIGYEASRLGNIIQSDKAKADKQQNQLTELHGYYKALIECKESDPMGSLAAIKMKIMGLEDSLGLTRSESLVDFKPTLSVDNTVTKKSD